MRQKQDVEKIRQEMRRQIQEAEASASRAIAERDEARAKAEHWRNIALGYFANSAALPWEKPSPRKS